MLQFSSLPFLRNVLIHPCGTLCVQQFNFVFLSWYPQCVTMVISLQPACCSNVSCLLPSPLSVTIMIFYEIRKSHFYHWRARLLRSQDSLGLILVYESWTFPNKYRHSSDDQAGLWRLPELSTLIITMFKGSKAAAN